MAIPMALLACCRAAKLHQSSPHSASRISKCRKMGVVGYLPPLWTHAVVPHNHWIAMMEPGKCIRRVRFSFGYWWVVVALPEKVP